MRASTSAPVSSASCATLRSPTAPRCEAAVQSARTVKKASGAEARRDCEASSQRRVQDRSAPGVS